MLNQVPLVRKARGAYYGWWVLGATFVLGVLSGGIFSHSNAIFFGPMKRDLGLTSAQTSLIFSLVRAEGSFAGPIVCWFVDRFVSRPMIMAGGLLASVGFMALHWVHNYVLFVVVFVGVVGVGRIGRRVIQLLSAFGARILANDLSPVTLDAAVQWVDKPTLYREVDLLTLHVPLTRLTRKLLGDREFTMLRPGALLINTSRGGVVDEGALAVALRDGRIGGAAIDTLADEPYAGELVDVENCLITPHMGSMSVDCRLRMEHGAARNAVAFLRGEPLDELVPESEYAMRASEKESDKF